MNPLVRRTASRRLRPALALAAGPLAAAACLAQTAQLQAPEAVTRLEPVIITGQKVRRSSEDTLTSTGVITGRQAEELNLRDLRDALKLQGNVYVAPSNNGNNGIAIRGINSEGLGEPGGNVRPLTTLVIDGAAQSFEGLRRGQRGTWDVEQIEVARGPQSTLQGRNALAGALTIKTHDPSDHWQAAARLNVGEAGLVAPALLLSGPIGSDWAFRFATEQARGNKGIRYTAPGDESLDDDTYRNNRFKLRWRPRALGGFEAKLTVSDTLDDPSVTAITLLPAVPSDSCPSGLRIEDRLYCGQGPYEGRRNRVRNHVLDLSQSLAPGVTLASTTAYVTTDARIHGGGTVATLPYRRDEARADADLTQEFRLQHAAPGARLTGVAGLFIGRFRNQRDSLVAIGGPAYQQIASHSRSLNVALFGEATWTFLPGWQLTAGARADTDRTESVSRNDVLYGKPVGELSRSDFRSHAFLPKLALAREFAPGQTLGATWSTGYRAGFRELDHDVKPEHLGAFELAWRSRLLDGRMQLSANLFHYDWRDQQLTVSVGSAGVFYTENVGRSHVDGGELSVSWRPWRRVDVGASLGLTHGKFDQGRITRTDQDFSGKGFPESPRLSGGLWATARFGTGWFLSADLAARGRAYASGDIFNDPAKRVPGRAVSALRAGYEAEWLSVVAWVDNLFDKQYLSGRDVRQGYYVGDPRRVGVTLSTSY
ncbi:MAG: TonB-dependent receptor [Roseateles sp.]|uniref:TonB-dependent receptor n=1 Tax=Roseateles sp. TaxID=1971397 RepID=UPI0039ECA4CE